MRKEPSHRRYADIAAYVADAAAVAFVATASVIAFTAVVEYYRPGTAASYLPPQGLFVVALASGIASLAALRRGERSLRQHIVFAVVAALATGFAGAAGWRYFGPLDGMRLPLTVAVVLITMGVFFSSARVAENDTEV